MKALVVATLLALAPPTPPAAPAGAPPASPAAPAGASPAAKPAASASSAEGLQRVGGGDPFFTRDEPALAAARRALQADDVDLAVDRAREAVASSADERAVVEYDAAQALRARARKDAAAAQPPGPQAGQPSGPPPGAQQAPAPPNLDDAIASFDRAAGLAVSARLQSEARLAAGNAALEAGKLDDAIAALRKAVVADPGNDRARRNLQRALEAKKAQSPPPPQEQQGDNDEDQQQQDQQKQDQQQQDQQKQDQQKQDQQKQDQQKQDQQKQDQQQQDQQKQDQQQQDQQQEQQQGAAADEQPKAKKPSKDEKRRLLQGLRSRERPLTPWEMRGVDKKRAPGGKDW